MTEITRKFPRYFRARWRDTGKPIPAFMEDYALGVLNDGALIVDEYTGATDKNNRMIYEGDICKVIWKSKYSTRSDEYPDMIVVWDDRRFQWIFKNDKYKNEKAHETGIVTFAIFDSKGQRGYRCEVEVIGDVYDNKELMA